VPNNAGLNSAKAPQPILVNQMAPDSRRLWCGLECTASFHSRQKIRTRPVANVLRVKNP